MNPVTRFVYTLHPKVLAAFLVSCLVAAAELTNEAAGYWPNNHYVQTGAVFLPVVVAYAKRGQSIVERLPGPPQG